MSFFSKFIGKSEPSLQEKVKRLGDLYQENASDLYKIILRQVQSDNTDYLNKIKNCSDDKLNSFLIPCLAAQLMITARFVFGQKYITTREEMDQIFFSTIPSDIITPVTEYFNKYQAIPPDRPEVMASKFGADVTIPLIDKDDVAFGFSIGFIYTACFISRTEWCVANAFGDKKMMKRLEYSLSLF